MKSFRMSVVASCFLALVAASTPAAAGRPAASGELVVALDGRFTTPVATTGNFVAVGLVNDSGTHTDVTSFEPKRGRPKLIVVTVTCTGSKGSFTFVGKIKASAAGFLSPGVSLSSAPGADRITSATGAYAPFIGALSSADLALTSNPLQPGAPGTGRAAINALRVIDVFKRHA